MLKRLSTITIFLTLSITQYSQVVSDSVTLGSGLTDQVFYQLSSGTKTTATNQDWDLQFFSSLFSASIRINGGDGVELFQAASTDTANFATSTLDTSTLIQLRDGFDSWEQDAFTSQQTGHPNYGWGVYQGIGNIVAVKIYAIKLTSGVYKKIRINQFSTSGTVTFSVANLDGSSLVVKTLNRSTYGTKRHFYYDVENDSVIDCEPAKTQWDMVFRQYSDLAGPSYYAVSGALTNLNIGVAQVNNTAIATAKSNALSYTLDSSINVLGYDWKMFDRTAGVYNIADSLSYIIKDYNEDVWQIVFTGFGGSATGKMYFTKERIAYASIEENSPVLNLGLFPNPTNGLLTINFELTNSSVPASISMMDVNGKNVKNIPINYLNSGFNRLNVDISDVPQGIYFITIQSGSSIVTRRLIKQ